MLESGWWIDLWEVLSERLTRFGEIPLCNGIAERAPQMWGFVFPLCWRCLGILGGYFSGLVVLFLKKYPFENRRTKMLLGTLLLILPTTMDGIVQYAFGMESTNFRRAWTGLLAGMGLGLLVYLMYLGVAESSKKRKHPDKQRIID
jgi:uncharacterized membrane protein